MATPPHLVTPSKFGAATPTLRRGRHARELPSAGAVVSEADGAASESEDLTVDTGSSVGNPLRRYVRGTMQAYISH